MMHRSSQPPILDIFFPGYRQAPTLSLLSLPSLRLGGSAPDLSSLRDAALKLPYRQCLCPTPNTLQEGTEHPDPTIQGSWIHVAAPKGWGAAGVQ